MAPKAKPYDPVISGRLGGLTRAANLSAKRRTEIARKAGKLGGWPKGKPRGPRKSRHGYRDCCGTLTTFPHARHCAQLKAAKS